MKKQNNLLVGAKVLIDWPMRWKDCRPEYIESEKENASKSESRFGCTGTIVAYNPGDEQGNNLAILIDGGRIENFHEGAVTVTTPAPDSNVDISALLKQILEAIKSK